MLPGRDIARHVEGCTRVVLLAVTLGAQSEMLLRRERALSATDGLLVDACASSLVEQAANVLNAHIVEEATARNLAATSRFSPGYGDLPLSCQPAFLVASGADRALGIHATAAHLLVPTKSITAVIGLRSHPNSARRRRKHRPYGGDALLHLPRRRYVRPARRRKDLLWQPRVSSP